MKRRFLINALASVGQVVIVGATFLVLYRFAKDEIGIERFGVWSLVLATTSASALAKMGMATSTIKFVAMYRAREAPERVRAVIETATLSLFVFMALVLAALYPLFLVIIEAAVEPGLLAEARAILPYALGAFLLTSTALVVTACLDGYQRIDLRSGLMAAAAVVYLGLVFVLVPRHGLVGLAQAQLAQAALLLATSWLLLRHLAPALPLVPYRWQWSTFKEMLSYSLNLQAISVAKLLFEPLTKILMMRFGGAAASGYFEFAYRMVVQLRALVVTAHQAIVPAIAELQERAPEQIRALYTRSFRMLAFLIVLALPLSLALTPLISRVWLGAYEPAFVLYANLLFAGWFINMLSNPAYFAYLGIGRLRWNVAGHFASGVLNGVLGFALGLAFGGTGVVVAFVVALLVGSLVITAAYQHEYRIGVGELVEGPSLWLGAMSLVGLGVAWALYDRVTAPWPLLGALVLGSYLALVAVPLWRHPAGRQLLAWAASLWRRSPVETPPEQP